MSSSIVVLAEAAAHTGRPAPLVYGGLAFLILMFLLLVTYAFRNVGSRRR